MGLFLDLYKMKLKIFLGAIKSSKLSLFLVVLSVLGITPGSIGMSMVVVSLVKEGTLIVYLDHISAIISACLALVLIPTYRGYVVFEYEQSLIFTSPITPKTFLVASFLADITAFSVFLFPLFLFLGIITISLALPAISVLSLVSGMLLFIFFLLFVKTSLSILASIRSDSLIKIVTAILMVFLLLPAVGLFLDFPLVYKTLPYPSTLLAQVMINALNSGLPSGYSVLFMTSYFLASLLLFLFCSRENLFQIAKTVPFVSPFDTSMRTQTVKMATNIRFFSKFGLRFTLNIESKSLLRFLMKKELVRMIRDGSLFAVLLFYLIVSIMSLVTSIGQAPFPVWLLILVIYSFIVPAVLLGNWRTGELDNLWIPLTSGVSPRYVARSLLYDFTLIAFIVPAGTIVILTFLSQIDPIVPLILVTSVSLIGCSTNLFTMIHFLGKKRRATPSFMIGWVSMLLSGLLISPTYIYAGLSFMLLFNVKTSIIFAAPILAYSIFIFLFLSRKIERKTGSVEI
jgi:hypothetical protein